MVEHDENALGISILIPEKGLHTLGTERRIIEIPGSHRQWMFHLILLTLSPLHSGQVTTDQIIHLLARFANAVPVSDSSPLKIPRHPIARRVAVDLLTSGNAPSRLEDFASRYGVSERTLRRVFAAESGVSFREFKKSASAKQMPSTLAHPVPALSTRWMNLLNNDVILWALRGRASIHLAPHTTSVGASRTQRLQAGQLMLIPSGHSLRPFPAARNRAGFLAVPSSTTTRITSRRHLRLSTLPIASLIRTASAASGNFAYHCTTPAIFRPAGHVEDAQRSSKLPGSSHASLPSASIHCCWIYF